MYSNPAVDPQTLSLTYFFVHSSSYAVLRQLDQSRYSCKISKRDDCSTVSSVCANVSVSRQAVGSLKRCFGFQSHQCRCGSACDTAAESLCSTHTTPLHQRATHTDAPAPANTGGEREWEREKFTLNIVENIVNRINFTFFSQYFQWAIVYHLPLQTTEGQTQSGPCFLCQDPTTDRDVKRKYICTTNTEVKWGEWSFLVFSL